MPLLLDTAPAGSGFARCGGNCLTIGFVNNMPDAAWHATERQFLDLIRAAAPDVVVRVKLLSIAGVPRADRARENLAARYRDIAELWDTQLDGLIVTGTEPRAGKLQDEPYWPALSKLVGWARENTASTIWSCLAAHAAVLHADGIEREPLKDKQFGVFDCELVAPHALMRGVPRRLNMPHSRYNDLPERVLAACGYRVLSRSAAAGVDTFVSEERGSSLFLFFQGHPEYDAATLLREYRRDVGRFLRGERAHYPAMPQGYFNDAATALAETFAARARREPRESLMVEFPLAALEAAIAAPWRRSALAIYQNWIDYLKDRQAQRRALTVLAQRPRRDGWRPDVAHAAANPSSAG